MAKDFTTALLVDQSPKEVFAAVMNVRGWWSGLYSETINGKTEKLDDEFSFRAGGGAHYTEQKLIELVPEKKVVWLVTKADLTFVDKKDEWKGTKLVFEIAAKKNKTELRFTHQGLVPEFECYDACSSAWQQYLDEKLLALIKSSGHLVSQK
jgi:hypothetical protein